MLRAIRRLTAPDMPFINQQYLANLISDSAALERCNSDELSCVMHYCSKSVQHQTHASVWNRLMTRVTLWDTDKVPLRHACRVLSALCAAKQKPSTSVLAVIDPILARGTDGNDLASALGACAQLRWTPPSIKVIARTIQDLPTILEVQSCIVLLSAIPKLKAPLDSLAADLEATLAQKVGEFKPIDCASLVQALANSGRSQKSLFSNTLRCATTMLPDATTQEIANLCNAVAKTEKDAPWFWEAIFRHLRHRDWTDFTAQGLTTIVQSMSRMQVSDHHVLRQIVQQIPSRELNEAEIALLANGLSNLEVISEAIIARIIQLPRWEKLGHLAMTLKALGKWKHRAGFEHCVTQLESDACPTGAAWIDVADVALGGQHINLDVPWVSKALSSPREGKGPKARPLAIIALALASVKGGDVRAWERLTTFTEDARDASPGIFATLCRAFHKVASTRKEPFESIALKALETLRHFDIPVASLTPPDLAICLLSLQTSKLEAEVLRRAPLFDPKDACMALSGLRSNPEAFLAFWDRRAFGMDVFKTWDIKDLVQLKALLETDDAKRALGHKRAQFVCTQLKRFFADTSLTAHGCVELLAACNAAGEAKRLISFVIAHGATFKSAELAQALSHIARLRGQVETLHAMAKAVPLASAAGDAQLGVAACASMDVPGGVPDAWLQAALDGSLSAEPRQQLHFFWALFRTWPREVINLTAEMHSWETWSAYEQRHLLQMAYDWHLVRGDLSALRLDALRSLFDVVSNNPAPNSPSVSVFQTDVGRLLPGKWRKEVRIGPYVADLISCA